jgi:ribonuclease HI
VNRPHDPGWDTLWDSVGATRPGGDRTKTQAKGPASAGGPAGALPGDGARGSGGADPTGQPGPAGPRTFIVRTDGAARGNPGPASLGAVLIDAASPGAARPDAPPIATISEYLGIQTNNVAEYTGVVRALALAEELGARAVDLLLDSKLIVEQLHGRWRVKDAKLIPLHADARTRLARFERWSARHVPRAQNKQADSLCNEAIDRVQAGGQRAVVMRPR